ncbi:MAG: CRISPR-associated protein Cas4 [Candidatus Heimdallarchaeota archaeon]|nr:CRISPR-associated protein Cas4 [Candidatus Heimdallarchaeota archaeon]
MQERRGCVIIIVNAEEIRQYVYCRRVIHFRRNFKGFQRKSYAMKKGETYHDRKNNYQKQYKNCTEIIENQYYYNDKLGIAAKIDLIKIFKNQFTVVEYKRYVKFPTRGHIYQAIAGVLAIGESLGIQCEKIEIMGYQGRLFTYYLGDELTGEVMKICYEIRKIIKSQTLPPISAEANKCQNCEFWQICLRV